MSSLSVTGKQIESLSATLIGLQESFAAIASQSDVSHGRRNTLEKLAESIAKQKVEVLDALELTVSKLVAKIDYKDPVSGAQRYGQSARAKILSFQEMIAQLQNAIDALSLEVTAQLKIVNDLLGECTNAESGKEQNIVAKNIKGTPIVGPIASIDRFVDFKVEKKAEHPCEAASDDLEDQSSELEEKARLVRERRAQEAEYASHVNHLVKATLEELITHLNQIRSIQLKRIVDKDSIHQLAGPMALLFEVQFLHF